MTWLEALLLGLVQGLTEFLPVSSSGHLTIGRTLLGVGAAEDLAFEVVVHAATVFATIVVFRKQILDILRGLFKFSYNPQTEYVCKIIVSMIPVFVVGVFFKDYVEGLFQCIRVVGAALLLTAVLLFFSDRKKQQVTGEGKITFRQAFVVGLGQALAVIPGLSRSGTTIATGLLCGMKRDTVAQFSFLMVIVPILGEAFLDLVGGDFAASSISAAALATGFAAAFLSGLFACKVMIAIVKKAKLKWFALYCALVGAAVLVFA